MLARGVDAVVQCGDTLVMLLDMPTARRGDSLDGFAAAAALRSLPHLLSWSAEAPPPPPALRDPGMSATHEPVVGDDTWETHLAACRGIATTIRLPARPDWLWGRQDGTSPWYRSLELVR
jgi:hypothetical protein